MPRWKWRLMRNNEIDIVGPPCYGSRTGAYSPDYTDHTSGQPVQPLLDEDVDEPPPLPRGPRERGGNAGRW